MENKSNSFEEKLTELELIVSELETGSIPLEEMISLYEKGKQLYIECNNILSSFEKRLDEVNKVD